MDPIHHQRAGEDFAYHGAIEIEHINPQSIPLPTGLYSTVSLAPKGARLAVISGQTGRLADGTISASHFTQCRDTFEHIRLACEAIGAGPSHIVHLRTLLVERSTMAAFADARSAVFAEWFDQGSPPSSTLAFVVGITDPEALCEIEALVAIV